MSHVKFELFIDTGNAAMQDAKDLSKALKHIAKRLPKRFKKRAYHEVLEGKSAVATHERAIMDENGNSIGSYKLVITEDNDNAERSTDE